MKNQGKKHVGGVSVLKRGSIKVIKPLRVMRKAEPLKKITLKIDFH